MKIANIMLGGNRGGVEQAAVDYARALHGLGHDVLTITRSNAAIIPALASANLPFVSIRTPQRWNLLARWRIAQLALNCDVTILHGNRAGDMVSAHPTRKNIAVAHSRFFTPLPHFDAVIALSEKRAAEIKLQFSGPVYIVSNMIDLPTDTPRAPWRTPPIIGSMGRLSHEKGFDLFLDALAILRTKNIPFHAIIGGEGKEGEALKNQASSLGIADSITWAGWVADKSAFFAELDVYCLPSRTENFPITLLEAMAHSCPAISTECGGGPAAMLADGCGILSPITDQGIAAGLMQALDDPTDANAMGARARARAAKQYATPVIAKKLHDILMHLAQ